MPAHEGIRTDRYKLIHFYDTDEWELLDLEKDPQEMVSVYDDVCYAPIVRAMKAELARLKAEYKVPPIQPQFNPNIRLIGEKDGVSGIETVQNHLQPAQ